MNAALIVQVLEYLVTHADDIAALIKALEDVAVKVVGDLKGPDKADVVKGYIAVQTNLVADFEPIWVIVKPVFDKYVAKVKAGA